MPLSSPHHDPRQPSTPMRRPPRPRGRLTLILLPCALAAIASHAAPDTPPLLPSTSPSFPARIHKRSAEEHWLGEIAATALSRKMLVDSIELARAYYHNNQLPEGNFVYLRDIVAGTTEEDDNEVRQAGATWGLSCLNRDRHTTETRHRVLRALDFFYRCSQPLKQGYIAPVYPGQDEVKTGGVALVCLAIVELWRGQEHYLTGLGRGLYETWLTTYLAYLGSMELDNGTWGSRYAVTSGQRFAENSPYFDGECLLAYCKAARYMNRKDLIPKIEQVAPLLAERYTVTAWNADPDSDETKGFFQWGCLAFAEHVEAGWQHADVVGDAALALAWWQIHEHAVENRGGNTAYAVEGLLGAYRVARERGDYAAMERLREVCERILVRLIRWQVGGPLKDTNPFLKGFHPQPETIGGIMSSKDSGLVRIDVVQHQLHAMLMALELLYPDTPAPPRPRPAKP
ncbi:MAG: hypothetical protein JXR77_04280 [Lentisphaeria bacterium]|nr:hypothetical protein [Lentisphaeria bacterium]